MITIDFSLKTSEDYIKWIQECADGLSINSDIRDLADVVLDNPSFRVWTGGLKGRHHYGTGLLLKHTYEVVSLCMQQAETFKAWGREDINLRVLFLAALYHDYGKVWDYAPAWAGYGSLESYRSTSHHRLIHHINRSVIEFSLAVERSGLSLNLNTQDQVIHAILSHHGSPNLGSPVMPKTREAWILHLCDSMSAWMDGADLMEAKK